MDKTIRQNIAAKLANGWEYAFDLQAASVVLVHADCRPIVVCKLVDPRCDRREFGNLLADFLNSFKPAKQKRTKKTSAKSNDV